MLSQVLHRVAAADEHVANIQLEPDDGRIEPCDEHVVWHLAIDRLHVIGLVVEREPNPRTPRDGAGGVETIRPLAPGIECIRRLRQARHDEIFVA